MQPPFVIVKWFDAWVSGTDSITLKDVDIKHRPSRQETAGWLLKEDEAGVSLANERCLDDEEVEYRGRTFIPKVLIQSVIQYKLTKPRKSKAPKLTLPET